MGSLFGVIPNRLADDAPLRPALADVLLRDFEPELSREEAIEVAWAATARHPDDVIAIDPFGVAIYKADHGKRTPTGWEVDHFPTPQCIGGKTLHGNIRAVHWEKNRATGGLLGALLQGK
jgi:hypothetical protein